MFPSDRSAQARRELDRKFAQANVDPIRARPQSGWIRSVRGALGLPQSMLAKRLGVSQSAVTNLEHAENRGGITITKLSEVAAAMDCFLVYAIVPNSTLERIVWTQAHRVAAEVLGYTSQTMALEDQSVDDDRQSEAVDRFAAEILAKGNQWRESFKFTK